MSAPPTGPTFASITARRGRHGNYSKSEIQTWARRISQWRRDTEVYVYLNNDWEGYALRNAQLLKDLLGL